MTCSRPLTRRYNMRQLLSSTRNAYGTLDQIEFAPAKEVLVREFGEAPPQQREGRAPRGVADRMTGMSINARRIRKRCQLTLAPDTLSELHARVLRSRAGGEWSNLSRETDRVVREAKGNLVTVRREVRGLLHPVRQRLQDLRREFFAGRPVRPLDLEALDFALAAIVARLEPPPIPRVPTPATAAR